MRVLLRASFPVEAGNKVIKDGSISKIIGEFSEKAKPECTYFTARGGKRTMYAVFDLKDSSNIPYICEPLFQQLNASIDFSPCMNGDDLAKGMKLLAGK